MIHIINWDSDLCGIWLHEDVNVVHISDWTVYCLLVLLLLFDHLIKQSTFTLNQSVRCFVLILFLSLQVVKYLLSGELIRLYFTSMDLFIVLFLTVCVIWQVLGLFKYLVTLFKFKMRLFFGWSIHCLELGMERSLVYAKWSNTLFEVSWINGFRQTGTTSRCNSIFNKRSPSKRN